MVAPWAACADCARAIVKAGIPLVVRSKRMQEASPPRWLESIAVGDEILQKGGVAIYEWPGKIGGMSILFNGEPWEV